MSRLNRFIEGVRVIDLSRHLPGPLATQLLADMGAHVVKVEAPAGDELRQIGSMDAEGRPCYFDAIHAGKQVLTLDLKQSSDQQRFLDLIAQADVLVESFRPGVMDRLGLGAAVLRRHNPRLIYCALSGYGQHGPLRDMAGHDGNYLAQAGALFANGSHGLPLPFMPPVADVTGSLFGLAAILGALFERQRSGAGCELDLALADALMPLQTFQLAELAATGQVPQREKALFNGGAAYYRVYPTADGAHVMLGAFEPKFWRAFCAAAHRPQWMDRHGDALPQSDLIAEVQELFLGLTQTEASAMFGSVDCCFSPVLDLAQAVDSPQVRARGLVRRDVDGFFQALFPALVDGQPPEMRRPLEACEAAGFRES